MIGEKGNSTKIKIIVAATELIYREGMYNVTYAQISKKVGLTSAAIYKHFEDMDDLIQKACEHWVDQARTEVIASVELLSAEKQLRYYITKNLEYTLKHRAQDALLLGLYYQSLHSKKLMKSYQEMKQSTLHRLQVLLVRGHLEGSWNVKNPAMMAETVHSLIVGEIVKLIIEPQSENIEPRIRRVTNSILKLVKD